MATTERRVDCEQAPVQQPGRDTPLFDVIFDADASNLMFQQFYAERQKLAQSETVDKIQKIEKIEKIVEVIAVEPEQEPWETHLLLLKWLFIITVVALLIAAIAFAAVMVH